MELFWEYARAFLCGGILCLIGQILIDKTPLTPAKILVTYVVSGVVLGALGIYKYVVAICWPRAWPKLWRKTAFWVPSPAALPPPPVGSLPPSSLDTWRL